MGRRAVVGTDRAWRGSGEGGGDGGGEGGGKAQARKVVKVEVTVEATETARWRRRGRPPGLLQVCAARTSGPQEAEEPDAETRARRRGPRSYHVAAALSPRSLIHISNSSEMSFTEHVATSNLNLSPHREDLTAYNSNVQSRIRRVGMVMTHAV
jgi:hypothetical protein